MSRKISKSVIAWVLIAASAATFSLMPAGAVNAYAAEKIGNGVTPTCDEAYYATMDYYGNLKEGSVVKSYAMNGVNKLTDYGVYDEVNNLTDGTVPKSADGKTVFNFGETVPEHFYFEGKTTRPFEKLPWTISMSYKLNGVPTKAEELAGKVGVVDIDLNFVPNENAGKYAKNNYTLEALAMFNQDDILSLEAEGAQVQLIGNLRVVLFVCLPGEENHFTISVGTEDFKFGGMTYLMVPATLSQLDMISGLAADKEDIENDYRKLNSSLDILLNSVGNMGGSLREAADGLDQINEARKTVSDGKDNIYSDMDVSLSDMSKLAEQLAPAKEHLKTAQEAIDDVTADVNKLHDKAYSMKSDIRAISRALDDVSYDIENFRRSNTRTLRIHTNNLTNSVANLEKELKSMNATLKSLKSQLSNVESGEDGSVLVNVGGNKMTAAQARAMIKQIKEAHAIYESKKEQLAQLGVTSFEAFLQLPVSMGGPGKTAAEAKQAAYVYEHADELEAQLKQVDAVEILLKSMNDLTVEEFEELLDNFVPQTVQMIGVLSDTCNSLSGLTASLSGTLADADSIFASTSSLTSSLKEASSKLEDSLELLDDLNITLNKYVPKAKSALKDCEELADTAQTSLNNLNKFLKDLRNLLKSADSDLDQGTKKALKGLACTLRKTAKSTDSADDVAAAKNNINDIIERLWNDHTGDADNLLNMDSTAEPVSLTSSKNDHPQSVQVLMRSQEIKPEKADSTATEAAEADKGTFWSRVGQMFKDFRAFITGIFS